MDWTLFIAAGSLELVILTSAIGVVWKLTRTEIALRGEFSAEIASVRAEAAREIADAQAKTYRVEIWARDEFVRKGSFETVVARLEKTMELMGSKIENAVDKMATRIENMAQHDR